MDTAYLETRLRQLFKPLFERHYVHAVKSAQYSASMGEVDPEPTRLEKVCKEEAEKLLKKHGCTIRVILQSDFRMLIQVAKDDPENLIANFFIDRQ